MLDTQLAARKPGESGEIAWVEAQGRLRLAREGDG